MTDVEPVVQVAQLAPVVHVALLTFDPPPALVMAALNEHEDPFSIWSTSNDIAVTFSGGEK